MKGDFSRLDQRNPADAAVLFQQGRPILDSQLNGAVLTVLRHLEETVAKLSGAVAFPRMLSNGLNSGKITLAADNKALVFPDNEFFVRGMRLAINSPHIEDNKAMIAEKKLFGVDICAGIYVLYVQVAEEAVSHYNLEGDLATETHFLRFADVAVPSSDSLRLRRFAILGLQKEADWNPRSRVDAKLTVTLDDRATENELRYFEYHVYKHDTDSAGQELVLKWSNNNAAMTFAVKKVSTDGITVEVPELATSMLTIRPRQLVELLGDYPHTSVDGTVRQLVPIKAIDLTKGKIELSIPLANPPVTDQLIRIWDGSLTLKKKPNGGNPQVVWQAKGPGFALELATESSEVPGQAGDYWQVALRIGDEKQVADRSTVLALEKLCSFKVVNTAGDLTLSDLVDGGNGIVATDGNSSTVVSAIATKEVIRDSSRHSPETLHVLHATSCRGMIDRVKCVSVKQWLASLSYAEMCAGTEAALRERIVRDCEGKLGPQDDLEGDLAVVFQERRKLNNDAGLSLA